MGVDEKDLKILGALKENARLTTNQIAKKTGIPITTVHNRIKRLVESGVIKKFTVELDYEKLDKGICAFILMSAAYKDEAGVVDQKKLALKLRKYPAVESAYIITGTSDLLLKTRYRNIREMNDFTIHTLRKIQGVESTNTIIVLDEV
ncbi:MAG: Lrp/AsnC family transcriptional regulator [archaeon]